MSSLTLLMLKSPHLLQTFLTLLLQSEQLSILGRCVLYVRACACVCAHVHVVCYIYVCVYVCICVCVCVHVRMYTEYTQLIMCVCTCLQIRCLWIGEHYCARE